METSGLHFLTTNGPCQGAAGWPAGSRGNKAAEGIWTLYFVVQVHCLLSL